MAELPVAAVVRIAKAAGAERVGQDGAVKLIEAAESFIKKVSEDAVKLAYHAGRKTIKEEDISMAAENLGLKI